MLYRAALTLIFCLTALVARAESLVVNSPGDGYLNLRTGPGSQYDIIMRMNHGTWVETLEIAGNWARVSHESGAVGWAYRKHMIAPQPAPQRFTVYSPNDGYLNLRSGPGTGYAIITQMYNGSWVEVLERSGNWVRVYHEYGSEGWAYSKYLVR